MFGATWKKGKRNKSGGNEGGVLSKKGLFALSKDPADRENDGAGRPAGGLRAPDHLAVLADGT